MKKLLFILIVTFIWAIPVQSQSFCYNLKSGVTVSGNVEQPTEQNPYNGEFHVQAYGGSGDFRYGIVFPLGSPLGSFTGDFYQLGPGTYDWFVTEYKIINGQQVIVQHNYPAFTIDFLFTIKQQPNINQFGLNPNKN